MPSKNSIKQYIENCHYHIYNRGVEKRQIFIDQQDYSVFLSYLKEYLTKKDINLLQEKLNDSRTSYKERERILKAIRLNNFEKEISLVAYCLMPNHFHFLIRQTNPNTIDRFMNSLSTRYTMYFNKKYKRVGALYQDVYKAVVVETEEQLLHLTRYIHKQALDLKNQPSSLPEYLGVRKTSWVKPEEILTFFSKTNKSLSYKSFVYSDNDSSVSKNLFLEADE